MKLTHSIKTLASAFATLALTIGATQSLQAQDDSLVALGIVSTNGTLENSTNTVGGVVSIVDQGTGDHDIVIDAIGAFTGASENDFFVEVTKRRVTGPYDTDNYITARAVAVTADKLTVTVRSVDLEDDGNKSESLDEDEDFNFTIRRINNGSTSVSGATSNLLALGRVNSTGTTGSALGVNGITVTTSRPTTGEYEVLLTKVGEFTGAVPSDFVAHSLIRDNNLIDRVAGISNVVVVDADNLRIEVDVDDVQDGGNGNGGNAANDDFYFSVYRIPSAPSVDGPDSALLVALANVTSAGALVEGASSIPGAIVTSTDVGAGLYEVDINATGAFAGKNSSDYIVSASIREVADSNRDRTISASVTKLSEDTMRVQLSIQDVENDLDVNGDLEDEEFAVALYDAAAAFQPDMLIGKKRNLTKMKGDGKYNNSGAGQSLRTSLPSPGKAKFFFAAQNDGNLRDSFSVKEKGAGNILRTKYIRLTGGRANVTASVILGNEVATDVAPGDAELFVAKIRYRSTSKTPRRKLRLNGKSLADASQDTVRSNVFPK